MVETRRFRWRTLVPLALLAAAMIVLDPGQAVAAVTFEVTIDPAAPHLGETAVVRVRTFETDTSAPMQQGRPLALDAFPWPVEAVAPNGSTRQITLHRSMEDPSVWTGNITFDQPGVWQVGMSRTTFGIGETPPPWTRLALDVRPPEGAIADVYPVLGAVLVVTVAALALAVYRRRLATARPRR